VRFFRISTISLPAGSHFCFATQGRKQGRWPRPTAQARNSLPGTVGANSRMAFLELTGLLAGIA
jgi:hypothetical protein